jgi:hypothetical protein
MKPEINQTALIVPFVRPDALTAEEAVSILVRRYPHDEFLRYGLHRILAEFRAKSALPDTDA